MANLIAWFKMLDGPQQSWFAFILSRALLAAFSLLALVLAVEFVWLGRVFITSLEQGNVLKASVGAAAIEYRDEKLYDPTDPKTGLAVLQSDGVLDLGEVQLQWGKFTIGEQDKGAGWSRVTFREPWKTPPTVTVTVTMEGANPDYLPVFVKDIDRDGFLVKMAVEERDPTWTRVTGQELTEADRERIGAAEGSLGGKTIAWQVYSESPITCSYIAIGEGTRAGPSPAPPLGTPR